MSVNVFFVRLDTDFLVNRKIRAIRSMPGGDTIVLAWLGLMCLAGKINDGGAVYIAEGVPYTVETLSVELAIPQEMVKTALDTFVRLKMIEIDDETIRLMNWEKYQALDKLEQMRNKERERKRLYREKIKCPRDRDGTVPRDSPRDVPYHNITEHSKTEQNIKEREKPPSPARHKYGEYKNVLLTDDELAKLKDEYPDADERIERLSEYIAAKGDKYKSHFAVIRTWARKDSSQKNEQTEKGETLSEWIGGI